VSTFDSQIRDTPHADLVPEALAFGQHAIDWQPQVEYRFHAFLRGFAPLKTKG